MPMTLASSGDGATSSLDPGSAAHGIIESMTAGLEAQIAAMAGSLSNGSSSSGVMTQQEKAVVLAELGRKAHAAIEKALQEQTS
jgi:hypothetical protein